MNAYEKALEEAGMTSEALKNAVLDKMAADNVNLKEFSEAQKNKIIKMYAATILAGV